GPGGSDPRWISVGPGRQTPGGLSLANFIHTRRSGGWARRELGGSSLDGGAMEHRGEAGPVGWPLAPHLAAATTVPGTGADRAAAAAAGEEQGQDRLRVRAKGARHGRGGGAGRAAGGRRRQ